eukprot:5700090-Pleurochrysis_carterae.AAC.1
MITCVSGAHYPPPRGCAPRCPLPLFRTRAYCSPHTRSVTQVDTIVACLAERVASDSSLTADARGTCTRFGKTLSTHAPRMKPLQA